MSVKIHDLATAWDNIKSMWNVIESMRIEISELKEKILDPQIKKKNKNDKNPQN